MNKASSILELDIRRAKKNNKYPLKIRVVFQRKFRRYLLGIDLTETEFANLSKSKEKKLKELCYRASLYSKRAEEAIEYLSDNFSFQNFEKKFFATEEKSSPSKQNNLYDQFTDYFNELEKMGRTGSADSYKNARNKLDEFVQRSNYFPRKRTLKTCYLEDVTPIFLKRFENYLVGHNISRSTIGVYTRNLRRIFSVAIADKKISVELYPFGKNKFSPPSSVKAKKALNIDDIEKIFNYQPQSKNEDLAKDMWLFCYYGNGLNFRDVALLKYENIEDDQIVFYRQKTINSVNEAKPISIFISPEIETIISKWGNKKVSDNPYVFNILKPGITPRVEKSRTNRIRKIVNKNLRSCLS